MAGILNSIQEYIVYNALNFSGIGDEREKKLLSISNYIDSKLSVGTPAELIFICTHNSRRSHMSQLWAQTAAYYFGIPDVHCYSGGTEATTFNPRAVKALQKAGFIIDRADQSTNPLYLVSYSKKTPALKAFSKNFADENNPQNWFLAIMTCSDANDACPFVTGADKKISIPYQDPGLADNTPEEEALYDERCQQIAIEMFYVFSKLKTSYGQSKSL